MVLRTIAIAIAVAALIDPGFGVARQRHLPLVIVDLAEADLSPIEERLRAFQADVAVRAPEDWRLPCGADERCVVAADGSQNASVARDLGAVSLIVVGRDQRPNLSLESATVSGSFHGSAAGAVRVAVRGDGVSGRRAMIRVRDGDAVIGSAPLEWAADGVQTTDVAFWPIAHGARVVAIEAALEGGDATAFDNVIDVPVTVIDRKLALLVFDTRPTWSSTFVRRALEDDPRFLVDHRARLAPALTAGTPTARLDAESLDRTPLLIVGAPDALSDADVQLIDRFVRVRGGSVILLPERAPSGAAARLFPGEWVEQLVARPEQVGPLRAAELLRPRAITLGALTLSPVVVATPVGNGRIVVSGAMDAWRHRDADAAAFDRFWTSLAAESASFGEKLRITFADAIASPGGRMPFTVRLHAMTAPEVFEASAVRRCSASSSDESAAAARAEQVRLWPAGAAGVFHGELPAGQGGSCTIEASVNGVTASAAIAVAGKRRGAVPETLTQLERAARASGGVVTDEDNLEPIRALNDAAAPVTAVEPVRPMRSPLWLMPFVGCLSIEWWLRRRHGLA